MRTSQTVGMVAVCIVAAFLVIIAVGPAIDKLQDPKLVTEYNEPDYRLESVDGYEGTILIVSVDLDGVPTASYAVTEGEDVRAVDLQGYDTRIWHFGDGYVLLTSSGIETPDGASMASAGDAATFSSGTVTAGDYTGSYSEVSVPRESGGLGHYVGGFRVTAGSSMQLYSMYAAASGTASSVTGWTLDEEKGEGNYLIESATDSDGYPALGFIAPMDYVSISQSENIASIIMDVVPLVLLVLLLSYAFMAFGGRR